MSRHIKSADSLEAAALANRAIEQLVKLILAEEGCSPKEQIPAALQVNWSPLEDAEEFESTLRSHIRVVLAEGAGVVRGHIYCHHCDEASCEHSLPTESGDVFIGYGPAGRPRYEAFFNYLLSLEDPRIQGALKDNPQVVARLVGRRRLMGEQLPAFGRGSLKYLIWGQVTAGYWRIGTERYAMTLQVVQRASRQLEVQVIAHPDFKDRMVDDAGASPRGPLASVWELIREVSRKIENLGQSLSKKSTKKEREEIKDKVFQLLRHFCSGVERKGRQHKRRTSHARKRGDQQRPVHKAYDDLKNASLEHFFGDELKGSVVVIGKSGRVHVYSHNGQHVTSLNLKRSEVERRQKRRRYIPLEPAKAMALKKAACAVELAEESR